MTNAPSTATRLSPTAVELIEIAVRLFGPTKVLDTTTREKCLADTLAIWREAELVIRHGGYALDIEGAQMRKEAEESDALRNWDDAEILTRIWGKEDKQAAKPGQMVPVTRDAIRKHLVKVLGRAMGNAVYYGAQEFGISRTSAHYLKSRCAEADGNLQLATSWRAAATSKHLATLLWNDEPGRKTSLADVEAWIENYLREKATESAETIGPDSENGGSELPIAHGRP
jgi:hypothetical protein